MDCLPDLTSSSSSDIQIPSSSDLDDDSDDKSFSSFEGEILWRKFDGLPEIPGLFKNVVAIFRENFGTELEKKRYSLVQESVKKEEKILTIEICQYLMENGVKRIQLFSNFVDYANDIGKELFAKKDDWGAKMVGRERPYHTFDYADVTILLLLECCGRWQQKRMFELVRDSYYGSRLGVVIIGNSSLLKEEELLDPEWKGYVDHLQTKSGIQDHLELYCKRHEVIHTGIFNGSDLQKKSKWGGCGKKCGELSCGHVCPFICHPIDGTHESEMFRCKQECKRRCPFGHECKRLCWEDCGICFEVVEIEEPCGHANQGKMVYCHEQLAEPCMIPVVKQLSCGHFAKMGCSKSVKDNKCRKRVKGAHNCGHKFVYRCSKKPEHVQCEGTYIKKFKCGHTATLPCQDDGLECEEICRMKLNCGHDCGRACHLEADPQHEHIKCEDLCNRYCSRGAHLCGEQGDHVCSEPCPPCMEEYEYPLECGHFHRIKCWEKEPEDYFCKESCMREHPFCRHQCEKLCGETCGICNVLVDKVAENCSRKHLSKVRCQEMMPSRCEWRVPPKIEPDCGHKILVYCYEADTLNNMEIAGRCEAWCGARLDKDKECGHLCRGTCKDCFQGRYHARCEEPCGRILICGHTCTSPCGMVCPPCRYVCMNYCEHGSCGYECGVPCERNCEEACPYMCEHSKCSKLCSEVCDKELCYQACKKNLDCGHSCVGFCGEECPPYCRLCTPKELLKGIFDGNAKVGPKDRFIYLKDCGHCILSEAMEAWLQINSEEIRPKICPLCRSTIPWLRRFSAIFDENWSLINSVRVKIFGKIEQIQDTIQLTMNMVKSFDMALLIFPDFVEYFVTTAWVPIRAPPKLELGLQSMCLDKANFLKMICHEWMSVTRIVWEFRRKLLPRHYDVFLKYWQEYMYDMIAERPWPLHPNEIGALAIERERLDDVLALYARVTTTQSDEIKLINASYLGSQLFQEAEDVLQLCKPYSDKLKIKFQERLAQVDHVLQCTIQLTETERFEIVKAFGEASGRWFKCENGHVYVVTECGGAMEIGKCNECGKKIGGESHMLVEKNYLATEMDGAELPLYPTVLSRK